MHETSPKLKRMTLKEQAYDVLVEMIASHRFSSGKWINAQYLAKEMGVSRTPVWQALKQLETEGLVQHVPNKGICMAPMTPQMAADLYLVRGVLEGLAAKLAAPIITPETLTQLAAILAEQKTIVSDEDCLGYSRSDFNFHAIIYEASDNWILQELLGNIKRRARPMNRDIRPIMPQLFQDHLKVVQALKERDGSAAEAALLKHNLRMRRFMEERYVNAI